MIELRVEGMTCGHCEQAVTAAVHTVAPYSTVTIDRPAGRVAVAGAADQARIVQAIGAAGFVVQTAN